jgi:hypothetical protein
MAGSSRRGIGVYAKKGKVMIPIEMSANKIVDYCKSNNLPNIGRNPISLANARLIKLIRESEII